jgi:transposase
VTYPRRDIVDGIRYVVRTGCQWDALPADFPPWPLVRPQWLAERMGERERRATPIPAHIAHRDWSDNG